MNYPEIPNEADVPDLATLRVLADGARHRILTLLVKEPLNVRELARRLKLPRTRLYYHLGLLERHGIIRSVSTRVVAGATEHTYRAVAKSFRVKRNVLAGSASAFDVDAAQADIVESAAHDLRTRGDAGDCEPLVARAFYRIDERRYAQLRKRIRALMREFERADGDGFATEVCIALFPTGANP